MYTIKPTDKLVKIKYRYERLTTKELLMIVAEAIISLMFIPIIFAFIDKTDTNTILLCLGEVLVAAAIPVLVTIPDRRRRRKKIQKADEIMAEGKRIIGEIKSLEHTEADTRQEDSFSYNIEYENPFWKKGHDDKIINIVTPSVLSKRMFIKKEDLPLKVVVYVRESYIGTDVHVDSVINPPVVKMHARKAKLFVPLIYFILFFGLMVASSEPGTDINIIAIILGVITCITIVAYIIIQQTLE